MATTLTDNLQGITPRMINVEDGGGLLTRASIDAMTPQMFEDFDNDEVRMERIIEQTKEARMCGAKQHGLMDLLLSRHVVLGMPSAKNGPSVIAPFDLIPGRSMFNFNYFTVTGGQAATHNLQTPGTATPANSPVTAGTGATDAKMAASGVTGAGKAIPYSGATTAGWVLTVTAGPADDPSGDGILATNFNQEGVKDLAQYFRPGYFLIIETNGENINDTTTTTPAANYAASAAYTIQLEVIGAKSFVDANGVESAYVVVVPSMTAAQYVALSAAEKDKVNPTGGGGCFMSNSVSDYEAYHEMPPAVNTTHLNCYWDQTMRWTDEYNDEYVKALQADLTTSMWKKFKTLSIAEQRRMRYQFAEMQFFNTIFYGQPMQGQSPNSYTSLPQVLDPINSGRLIEYKSNTVGIKHQCAAFNRVHNAGGGAMNVDTLFEALHQLSRNREYGGGDVLRIEGMTDRHTAGVFQQLMSRYYQQYFGFSLDKTASLNKTIHYAVGENFIPMWSYDEYPLPNQGINLVIIKDRFFEDHVAAMPNAGLKNRARGIFFMDWSDITVPIKSTRSVKRQTNVADDLYNTIIQPNVEYYVLNSKKFQVRVGDPNRHMIIENFSLSLPTATTVAGGVQF